MRIFITILLIAVIVANLQSQTDRAKLLSTKMAQLDDNNRDLIKRQIHYYLDELTLKVKDIDLDDITIFKLEFSRKEMVDGCYVESYFSRDGQNMFSFAYNRKGGKLLYVKQVVNYKVSQHFSTESFNQYLKITDPSGYETLQKAIKTVDSGYYEKPSSRGIDFDKQKLLKLGLENYSRNEVETAKMYLKNYVDKGGNDFVGCFTLGLICYEEKEYNLAKDFLFIAIKEYNEFTSSKSESIMYHDGILFLSTIYLYKKEYSNSIKYSTIGIKAKFHELNLRFIRAMAKSALKDYYGSINDYDHIIKYKHAITEMSNFDLATVYNNKAYDMLLSKKDKSEALKLINKALLLNDSHAYIWSSRGEINFIMENYGLAISDLSKSLSISETGLAYYLRGMAYIKNDNVIVGCIDLSKAGEFGYSEAYNKIQKHCNH